MELFGRSGATLLPFLQNGSASIRKLEGDAKNLGLVMSNEDAAAAAELSHKMNDVWQSVKMVAFHVGSVLKPVLEPLIDRVLQIGKAAMDWVQANKGLIASAAKLAAVALSTKSATAATGTETSCLSEGPSFFCASDMLSRSFHSAARCASFDAITASGQEIKAVVDDRCVDRRALVFPIGDQFVQRDRIDHRPRKDMRADFGTFLKNANAHLAPGLGGELFQPDRRGQPRRSASHDHNVVLHALALDFLGHSPHNLWGSYINRVNLEGVGVAMGSVSPHFCSKLSKASIVSFKRRKQAGFHIALTTSAALPTTIVFERIDESR